MSLLGYLAFSGKCSILYPQPSTLVLSAMLSPFPLLKHLIRDEFNDIHGAIYISYLPYLLWDIQ